MTTPATRERHRLADELEAVGPDAPTLCGGWDTRMLAAHIVLRDRRPDAAPGILIPAFAGHTERVQKDLAKKPFDELVDEVRDGPPVWNPARIPAVDRAMNSAEFFVHLEDVRRAQPKWDVRDLADDEVNDLYAALKRMAPRLTHSSPVGITLTPDDDEHQPVVARSGDEMVTVSGPVGELVLWAFGRKPEAKVDIDGSDSAVAAAVDAKFSL